MLDPPEILKQMGPWADHGLRTLATAAGTAALAYAVGRFRRDPQTETDLSLHRHIIGAWGAGKSTLMLQQINQALAEGRHVFLVDPHGETAKKALERVPTDYPGRVVVNVPGPYPLGLNPLRLYVDTPTTRERAVGQTLSLLSQVTGPWGDVMTTAVLEALWAVMERRGTLLDVMRVVENDNARLRLKRILLAPSIRALFTSPQAVDFGSVLASERPTFYVADLGQLADDSLNMAYASHIIQFQQAVMARDLKAPLAFAFFDEIQRARAAVKSLEALFFECRKYRVCVTIAHQVLDGQLPGDMARTIWACPNQYVFRCSPADAGKAAPAICPRHDGQQGWRDRIVSLPNYMMARREIRGGVLRAPEVLRNDPDAPRVRESIEQFMPKRNTARAQGKRIERRANGNGNTPSNGKGSAPAFVLE